MTRIRLLFLANGVGAAVLGPFSAVILAGRGFDAAGIGLLSAMCSVAFVLSISGWGHLADVVLGRARALRAAILGAAAFVIVFFLPVPPILVGAAFVAYWACFGAVGPLSDALAVNAMRDPGREYGRVRGLASASFAVSVVGLGLIYARTGYDAVGVLFVAVSLLVAVVAGRVPDLRRATLAVQRRGGAVREVLALQPGLPRILLAVGLAYFGVFAGFTFLSLRIVELGGGPLEVALSAAIAAAAEVGAMVGAGRLLPRFGARGVFAGSALVYIVAMVLWIVLGSPVAIIASRLISGAGYSGLWIATIMTVRRLLPPALQGSGQALISMTTTGGAAFMANVVGGLLYAQGGHAALYGVAIVVTGAGGLLGWFVLPGVEPQAASGVS